MVIAYVRVYEIATCKVFISGCQLKDLAKGAYTAEESLGL